MCASALETKSTIAVAWAKFEVCDHRILRERMWIQMRTTVCFVGNGAESNTCLKEGMCPRGSVDISTQYPPSFWHHMLSSRASLCAQLSLPFSSLVVFIQKVISNVGSRRFEKSASTIVDHRKIGWFVAISPSFLVHHCSLLFHALLPVFTDVSVQLLISAVATGALSQSLKNHSKVSQSPEFGDVFLKCGLTFPSKSHVRFFCCAPHRKTWPK